MKRCEHAEKALAELLARDPAQRAAAALDRIAVAVENSNSVAFEILEFLENNRGA